MIVNIDMDVIRDIDLQTFHIQKSQEDKIRFLLQFAVLAPSTHNSQPWLFKIKENSCEIHINAEKKLIASDKSGRNLYISIGACLENLVIVAKYFGVYSHIGYHQDIKGDTICEVNFKNLLASSRKVNKKYELLTRAILDRVTNRGFYNGKKIPINILKSLENLSIKNHVKVNLLTTNHELNKFTDTTIMAIKAGYSSRAFRKELSSWINSNVSNRAEGIPGYSLNLPLLISMVFPFLLRNLNLSNIVAKINKKSLGTMSAVCIICTPDDNKAEWIKAGRVSQRALLLLTEKGLSTYITVAAVDINEFYLEIQQLLKTAWRPQFSFTFGYSDSISKFPPRYLVKEKLI